MHPHNQYSNINTIFQSFGLFLCRAVLTSRVIEDEEEDVEDDDNEEENESEGCTESVREAAKASKCVAKLRLAG